MELSAHQSDVNGYPLRVTMREQGLFLQIGVTIASFITSIDHCVCSHNESQTANNISVSFRVSSRVELCEHVDLSEFNYFQSSS